jgi:two-component system response regulator HydG
VENASQTTKKHIVVVDDDPSVRHMLARVLSDEGYETSAAADGRAGLKIIANSGVDLVLLDLKMAGMSGEETLKELSTLRPALPVVVITAYPRPRSEMGAVSALLLKPLDFQVLLETIKNLLARKEKNG